jgi:hypothetical protein
VSDEIATVDTMIVGVSTKVLVIEDVAVWVNMVVEPSSGTTLPASVIVGKVSELRVDWVGGTVWYRVCVLGGMIVVIVWRLVSVLEIVAEFTLVAVNLKVDELVVDTTAELSTVFVITIGVKCDVTVGIWDSVWIAGVVLKISVKVWGKVLVCRLIRVDSRVSVTVYISVRVPPKTMSEVTVDIIEMTLVKSVGVVDIVEVSTPMLPSLVPLGVTNMVGLIEFVAVWMYVSISKMVDKIVSVFVRICVSVPPTTVSTVWRIISERTDVTVWSTSAVVETVYVDELIIGVSTSPASVMVGNEFWSLVNVGVL